MPVLQGLLSSLQTRADRIANDRGDCIKRAASIVERPRARSSVRLLFPRNLLKARRRSCRNDATGRITRQRFAVLPSSRRNPHVAARGCVERDGSAHGACEKECLPDFAALLRARRLRSRAFSSTARSRPAGSPCRRRPASPDRRTSPSWSAWPSPAPPCRDAWR